MLDVTDSTFSTEVLNHNSGPVIVDFWAPWCAPCKVIAPILEQAAAKYASVKFVKIDCSQNPGVASRRSIRSVPALLVFQEGVVIKQHNGPIDEAGITELLRGALARLERH
jgi:thioredoxin 1